MQSNKMVKTFFKTGGLDLVNGESSTVFVKVR